MLGLDGKGDAALIQHPVSRIEHLPQPQSIRAANRLWYKKDFIGVGIFHFRSWRESFHIDVLAR
jgi:hypothetical protein